ncbi:isocitrate lyase/PEP mutase family protein [Acidisoma cellulosilytica]|uniref:Isocitrate lyase/PEP mutase family protein n=1 Tax=Acidisoma cellulosilyticum TaxID=2802395 RepID=A0A964E4M2_9PROT|nr:isocitrate lyase/PEP mutase family protein [Acidisoma cellulosilyticum]MCB8881417.1 isocitrate lyase/PEP mutase family protein [Acidisoma cellulosilyticum]
MTRSARFRELLKTPPFVCMGAHDAITAKLAEQAGASAIFVSGFAASAVLAGAPDVGLLTQTEMFEHIRRICRATTLPVFADADTGYGGVLESARTIQLWEEAGASVLHLEDQAAPKKCGHFTGKQLISPLEMQQKLRAMLDARRDPDFFIVARTDALAVTGLDDAIARLTAYAAVGADGLYMDAMESVEQMREVSDRLKPLGKPLLFNMARSGKSPFLSLQQAHELGFDFTLCPIESMFAMHKAVKTMMETFLAEGASTNAVKDMLTPFDEFNQFIGLPEVLALEKRYAIE